MKENTYEIHYWKKAKDFIGATTESIRIKAINQTSARKQAKAEIGDAQILRIYETGARR